jgi:predicted alpha/beta hydrolase family esterase
MRTSDVDILIIPGLTGSGPDHWQSRWEAKLSTARRVAQDDWDRPQRDPWVARLVDAVAGATRPAVLVAHSLGVLTVVHAAPQLPAKVAGAFLVAPPDETALATLPEIDPAFMPIPRAPLPFPATLVASDNDPYCGLAVAEDLSFAWGAAFANAGAAGHINTESGHGPWPEGLLGFANFLKRLGPAAP